MARARLQVVAAPANDFGNRFADAIEATLAERQRALRQAIEHLRADVRPLARAADLIASTLHRGGKVLTAGNGGSAAEAQHLAAELVGRFKRERAALPALSLTADTSVLTAIANDFGYDQVFARQVEAWGNPGDAIVLFSTSGESPNILAAAQAARSRGLRVIAVTGAAPCRLTASSDVALRIDSSDTPVVQEMHVVVLHLLCDLVEAECGEVRR
ncbi:MAG TPA: SIS domain-containing protein [Thermomicrobiales bacterium]|nr:SIS domain-containing protein [Thermomicrobiales bacterium]